MKKLFLISVVGFVLIGCSENGKITKEFLNGDWDCSVQTYIQKDINDKDVGNLVSRSKHVKSFKIINDKLYSISDGEVEHEVYADKMFDTLEVENSNYGITSYKDTFNKVNDDKWTWYSESKQSEFSDPDDNYIKTDKLTCIRIK